MAPPFNKWYNALRSLVELAFTGSPASINLEVENFVELSKSQVAALGLWFALYILYILFSLILLLNLLIAMLSFTFDTVRDESTLQCRTSFAQLIMRFEIAAASLNMPTCVGEMKEGGKYTYDFRQVAESVEGGVATGGSSDPFANQTSSATGSTARLEQKLADLSAELAAVRQSVKEMHSIVSKDSAAPVPIRPEVRKALLVRDLSSFDMQGGTVMPKSVPLPRGRTSDQRQSTRMFRKSSVATLFTNRAKPSQRYSP